MNDIAHTNTIVGIGTTLHKLKINGEDIYLPCLSYHLPSADVRLFSRHTYLTLYGGHSAVFRDRVQLFIDSLWIDVAIDRESLNVLMVYDCWVEHGPHIRSALPQYETMVDFLGGWSSAYFQKYNIA